MYKSMIVIVALLVSSISGQSFAKAKTSNEYEAVVATAYKYFNGAANGDQALLNAAFDTDFGDIKMPMVDKETGNDIVRTVPLAQFAKVFKKPTPDLWQAKVLSVDIVDDKMAMVKLDFDTPKTHYVDYLVMYKRNGQWRIVNKTFVATKK